MSLSGASFQSTSLFCRKLRRNENKRDPHPLPLPRGCLTSKFPVEKKNQLFSRRLDYQPFVSWCLMPTRWPFQRYCGQLPSFGYRMISLQYYISVLRTGLLFVELDTWYRRCLKQRVLMFKFSIGASAIDELLTFREPRLSIDLCLPRSVDS